MKPMDPVSPSESEATRRELGIPQEAFVFCNASRLDEGKGHYDIIEAFSMLARACPEAFLVIMGTGFLAEKLKAQAANASGSERILFTGRRTDVPRILGSADAFVHPSRYDACPLAILEAMASGLPVLAYAEGGAKQMVADGVTGYLAPPADIGHLSAGMRQLYDDPSRATAYGLSARHRLAKEFRPDRASARFVDIVNSVCR